MEHKLDCAIVRDLLPSYADGLSSEETNRAVEGHLSGCPDCAQTLRLMKEPEEPKAPPETEVDYLKKVRSRSKTRSLLLSIVLMLIAISLLGYRYFYVGYAADASDALYEVSVDGREVRVTARLTSSGLGIARVTFSDSNGMVQAKVYTAPKAFFNHGDYMASYTAASPVGQVRCGDLILWEDGTAIDPVTARLFAAANLYVGDMPSNNRIAEILGVSEQFGPYTNTLHTAAEPYGWTLTLAESIAADGEKTARGVMAADACAMLAVIGNLGYVTWEYTTENGPQTCTFTAEDASKLALGDIKERGASASSLQALTETLGIRYTAAYAAQAETEAFILRIENDSEAELSSLEMDHYLGDAQMGTQGVGYADGSVLRRGDTFDFTFTARNFPGYTPVEDLSNFRFDLTVIGAEGERTGVCRGMSVPAVYGETVVYVLGGDAASGFTLRAAAE